MILQINPFDAPRVVLDKVARRMCKYPYHQLVRTIDHYISVLTLVVLVSASFSVAGANIEYTTLAESVKEAVHVFLENA